MCTERENESLALSGRRVSPVDGSHWKEPHPLSMPVVCDSTTCVDATTAGAGAVCADATPAVSGTATAADGDTAVGVATATDDAFAAAAIQKYFDNGSIFTAVFAISVYSQK